MRAGIHPAGISEASFWTSHNTAWRQLHGNFQHLGVSLESHDLFTRGPLDDWHASFHPDSLELCLNLSGNGSLVCRGRETRFSAGTAFYYRTGRDPLSAVRAARQHHRFITLECRRDFLLRLVADCDEGLETALRDGLLYREAPAGVWGPRPLTPGQVDSLHQMWQPPVASAARSLWYRAKISEIIAEFLFPPTDELFCDRQKRLARERVARVVEILRSRLHDPPPLAEIAREVGVSPFHLSRTFSQEMRMSIPRYLRQIRMERAAALLEAGTHNVTEAAFEVGYSSLGNFSKTFAEILGCPPGSYPPVHNTDRG